jgi:hypothetical protein
MTFTLINFYDWIGAIIFCRRHATNWQAKQIGKITALVLRISERVWNCIIIMKMA